MEQGNNPISPVPTQPEELLISKSTPHISQLTKGTKGLSVAALVLSIIGLVLGLIFFVSIPLAVTALILAIISLATHRPGRGMSIAAVIIGGLALVIAPLGVITIIAYTGVSNRANSTGAETNATTVERVLKAFAAGSQNEVTHYPSSAAELKNYVGSTQVPSEIDIVGNDNCDSTGINLTCLNKDNKGLSTVLYVPNSNKTGACIGWYDFQVSTTRWIYVGDAYTAGFKQTLYCN